MELAGAGARRNARTDVSILLRVRRPKDPLELRIIKGRLGGIFF